MEATVARRAVPRESLSEKLSHQSVRSLIWLSFITFIILVGSVGMLFPIFFMMSTSLKTSGDVFLLPIRWLPWIQFKPQFTNFPDALNFMKWTVVYQNTLTIAVGNMLGDTLSALLVAYGFSRFLAPG